MCTQLSHDLLRKFFKDKPCVECAVTLNSIIRSILKQPTDPAPDIPFKFLPEDFGKHTYHGDAFEVSEVHMKTTGSKPENAFLYVELIIKGNELSPLEFHMPLPTCKSRYILNKNVVSLTPDGVLPVFLSFFQEIANTLKFGDEVNF